MGNTRRRDHIFNLLEDREQMSVSELANYFHVTETTIRRDLLQMEEDHQVIRKRGYAFLPKGGHSPEIRRPNTFKDEKVRIAKQAIKLCENLHSIALDSGTTITELVHLLMEYHSIKKYEFVTCSLSIAYETSRYFHTYIPGGLVYPDEFSVSGFNVKDFFKNITTDIVFLGSTGLSNTEGLTVSYLPMMETKKAMIECSAKKVALVDSSKFLTRGLYTFSKYEELDILITVETEQNKNILREIESKGVTIIRA